MTQAELGLQGCALNPCSDRLKLRAASSPLYRVWPLSLVDELALNLCLSCRSLPGPRCRQHSLAQAGAPRPRNGLVGSPLLGSKGAQLRSTFPHTLPDSLLPPGEKQAVVEEVQVDGLAGQLQLGRGCRGQRCQLHQLPVPHQPAGLGDQREDLGGQRRQRRDGSGPGQQGREHGPGRAGVGRDEWPAAPREGGNRSCPLCARPARCGHAPCPQSGSSCSGG